MRTLAECLIRHIMREGRRQTVVRSMLLVHPRSVDRVVIKPGMASRVLRLLSSIVLACGIASVCTVGLALFWKLIGGGALSIHGWIAMALGIFGTVGLSWVLMGLAFRSNREGWDDQVDNSLDPGRQSHQARAHQDKGDDDLIY